MITLIFLLFYFSMPLAVIVVVSNVLHAMYIPCNLNTVKIFAQYYVNRVSAVSSSNSVYSYLYCKYCKY